MRLAFFVPGWCVRAAQFGFEGRAALGGIEAEAQPDQAADGLALQGAESALRVSPQQLTGRDFRAVTAQVAGKGRAPAGDLSRPACAVVVARVVGLRRPEVQHAAVVQGLTVQALGMCLNLQPGPGQGLLGALHGAPHAAGGLGPQALRTEEVSASLAEGCAAQQCQVAFRGAEQSGAGVCQVWPLGFDLLGVVLRGLLSFEQVLGQSVCGPGAPVGVLLGFRFGPGRPGQRAGPSPAFHDPQPLALLARLSPAPAPAFGVVRCGVRAGLG